MGQISDDMNAYVMGFFLSLSILNVWENSNTFFTRRKKLDAVQWIASIAQISNLSLHMTINTAKDLPCLAMAWIETSCYYVLQLGSSYVIIYRATAIVSNCNLRYLIRLVLGIIQACSLGFNLVSIILVNMQIVNGTCVPDYDRRPNDIGKIFMGALYIGLLFTFGIPAINNIKNSQQYVTKSTLKDLATITAIKIIFAIFAELVTVILSIIGIFGDYFWIQFTFTNFGTIWSSTVASRVARKAPEATSSFILSSAIRKTITSRSITKKGAPISVQASSINGQVLLVSGDVSQINGEVSQINSEVSQINGNSV